ncbi:MAG: RNA polymerase sigma factor [Terracidiphilus sp.]
MNSTPRDSSTSQYGDMETTARDQELLFAARAGSHAAFEELRDIYAHLLYKRIFSITRNREDTEDALQETFMRAFLALPSFEGRAKLSSWLTKIAINSALMVLRKRCSRQETSFEFQPTFEDDILCFDIRDNALNPEQLCDQKQRSYAILRAIEGLDPKSRTAIIIWVSQELSMKEIAENLGVTVASVKSRLHRARQRLIRFPDFQHPKAKSMPPQPKKRIVSLQNREHLCLI